MKTLSPFSVFLALCFCHVCPLPATGNAAVYPLKVSDNKRYLVDQNNVPFMIIGDSAWSLITNLTETDAATYFADRKARGYNAVLLSVLVGSNIFGRADFSTYDGIIPFTTPGDLATPNPTYFQRVDDMIQLAATYDLCVFLVPTETDGWLKTFQNNGVVKCSNYGRYLGNRYKHFPNIVWAHGNDYQTWPAGDNVLIPLADGIKGTDPTHLQTIELNFLNSSSLDDNNWRSLTDVNWIYTYFPTYAEELKSYSLINAVPVMLGEACYEQEHNGNTDGGSIENLRRQEYWTALAGTTGQLYGSYWTDRFATGWQRNLDTPGALQLGYLASLFAPLQWYNLVPDQGHTFVTAGYGVAYTNLKAATASGTISVDTYATAAITPDGTLAVVYLPTIRTITVNLAKFVGPTTVQWFDPSNGRYAAITGSPFANTGSAKFTPPGKTSDGQGDWVLVFTTAAVSSLASPPAQDVSIVPGTAVQNKR
jgi:hypothetical protein